MTHTEKFHVRNCWTNAVKFTADITCPPDASVYVKLGFAVRWGVANNADLSGAALSGADLRGAVLCNADLRGAVLSGAVLSGAVLRGAVLSGAALSGAVLRGAVLRNADLSGEDLSGADKIDRLLAVAQRLDGYDFHAYRLRDGSVKIVAGCRYFTPDQFRAHVAVEYPDTLKAVETLSIIEHIERMAALFPAGEVTA